MNIDKIHAAFYTFLFTTIIKYWLASYLYLNGYQVILDTTYLDDILSHLIH